MQNAKPTLYQRWARSLIELYPASWRERYADEMLLLLEDAPPTFKTVCNLFIHLFDAHIHRYLVAERTPHMLQKMRANELAIYGSTLIFFVAWLVAQRYITITTQSRSLFGNLSYTSSSPLVNIIHVISSILLLLILCGGLPILLSACWKALQVRNLLIPLLCLMGLIGPLCAFFLAGSALGSLEMTALRGIAATSLALVIFFIGLAISLALIFFAIQRIEPSRRITQYGLSLATLLPTIMVAGLVALVGGVLPSFAAASTSSDALLYTIRETLLIFVMVGTLAFTIIALKRGRQAKQAM